MRAFYKIEISRILKNKLFWISLIIGCLVSVSQYFMYVVPNVKYLDIFQSEPFGTICPHTWYEKWIGGEISSSQSYIYFMLIPILSVLPHSTSVAYDRTSGYTYNIFVRGNKHHYYVAKFITTFLSGGTVIVFPLILNLVLSACTLPSILPDPATGTSMICDGMMWSGLYFDNPNLYIVLYLIIIFLFAGLMAVLGLTIGTAVYSNFMITIMPFVIYLFGYAVCTLNRWHNYCPFMYLTPAQRTEHISLSIIAIEMIVLFILITVTYAFQAHMDETLG